MPNRVTRRGFLRATTGVAASALTFGAVRPLTEVDLFRRAIDAAWRMRDQAARRVVLAKLLPMATTLRDQDGVREVVRDTADRALASDDMTLRAEVAGTAVLVGRNLGDHRLFERALDAVESGREGHWTIERYKSDADFLRGTLAVASVAQGKRILDFLDAVPTGPMDASGFAVIHDALLRFIWWQRPHLDHEARARCHTAIARFARMYV